MLVVSTGCPSSIGPEISVRAAASFRLGPCVLVGDRDTLLDAADLVGVPRRRLKTYANPDSGAPGDVFVLQAGPRLTRPQRKPGKPGKLAGRAQLAYVERAAELARTLGAPLVTAAVSKAAIAGSGAARARRFRGHTEWLATLARAPRVTMCFWTPRFSTALVTTHLPLSRVARAIEPRAVATTTIHLAQLLAALGRRPARIAVCSLNPHAGEGGLLGDEEARAIVPAIRMAERTLGPRAARIQLLGAETAYRLAMSGEHDGVVAMYHDQATIPTKLTAFGKAVNVTMGLGYVRTSVDHGTAYDIAWQGKADPGAMLAAMRLANLLHGKT